MCLNIDRIEYSVISCVNKAKSILVLEEPSDRVVGVNPWGDLSKEFDIRIEEALVSCLKDELRDIVIVGEERGIQSYGERKLIAMIDPVDGSRNYEADIPWSAISIAIANGKKDSPKLGDVFFALLAEISRNRIYIYREGIVKAIGTDIKRRRDPKNIVLGYFDSYESFKALELYIKNCEGFKVLRILGSAALDIVSVALGNAEVFIDIRGHKLRNIDVVAALRIALALGAKAYIPGYRDPLELPLDTTVKIDCIVGFNDTYLRKVLKILEKIGFLERAS